MKLYNAMIREIPNHLGSSEPTVYPYCKTDSWEETDDFELVMLRDAAYELGGKGKPSASLTCVTTDPALVSKDEILVIGKDLQELKADTPYARIALIQVADIESDEEDDTEQAFLAIQNIDFVKYHVYPKGFMMRTSSESQQECVRVSKAAVKQGISFRAVGSCFISHYKQDPNVVAVKLIFITASDADYKGMRECAKTTKNITMTLTKIMEGLDTDCGSCSLKPICDEVEGMKELHFGKESRS